MPRALRKRMTVHEAKLWNLLRERFRPAGFHFRRQVPIGRFVVDFACLSRKLTIELDGDHHGGEATALADRSRDAVLEGLGYRVLRFWNRELDRDTEAVMDTIWAGLDDAEWTPDERRVSSGQ